MNNNLDSKTLKTDAIFKNGGYSSTENILKNFPYFYYNSELYSDYQEMLNKKFENLNPSDDDRKKSSDNSPSQPEKTLKEKIEGKIKSKYNLIIPAILIELAENGKESIEFQKEDLKNLLTSLGVIKHIEINGGIAYVLYEHYFSALLAFNVLNEIISADKTKTIAVKLFTKEEEEEKQNKSQDKHNIRENASLLEFGDKEGNKTSQDEFSDNTHNSMFEDFFRKNEVGSTSILLEKGSNFLNHAKTVIPVKGTHDSKSKLSKDSAAYTRGYPLFPQFPKASYSSLNINKQEENKAQSIFVNDIFSPLNQDEKGKKNTTSSEGEIDNRNTATSSQAQHNSFMSQSNLSFIPKSGFNTDSLLFPGFYPSDYLNPSLSATNQSLNDSLNTYLKLNMSCSPQFEANFKTVPTRMYLIKYVCNYDIQIENEPGFQVTRRLIGNKGAYLRKILYDTCIKYNDCTTKIRLRGKGSGYKEGSNMQESEDPLQLCVSSLNYFNYSKCCKTVDIFLNQIYYEYFLFLFNRKQVVDSCPRKIVKNEYVINRY